MCRTLQTLPLCLVLVLLPAPLLPQSHKKLTIVRTLNAFNKKLDTLEQTYGHLPPDEKQRLQKKVFDFLNHHAQRGSHIVPADIMHRVIKDLEGYFSYQFKNLSIDKKPYDFLGKHRRSTIKTRKNII